MWNTWMKNHGDFALGNEFTNEQLECNFTLIFADDTTGQYRMDPNSYEYIGFSSTWTIYKKICIHRINNWPGNYKQFHTISVTTTNDTLTSSVTEFMLLFPAGPSSSCSAAVSYLDQLSFSGSGLDTTNLFINRYTNFTI